METDTSHNHSPALLRRIDCRRRPAITTRPWLLRARTSTRMTSICSRCCVFLLLICMCQFRVLEAAGAPRTLLSHSSHEDSSHEKKDSARQNDVQHAVLPAEESVHVKTLRPALKNMAEIAAKDPYGHLVVEEKFFDIKFIHAFISSLSVIIVSEIGDKTFFIAAIMAMRHSRLTVFAGAIGALATMTVLSAVLGYATTIIPRWFTYYVSTALFFLFGLKMLKEGYDMSPDEGKEEYEEVQADLRKQDEEGEKQDVELGFVRTPQRRFLYSMFSRIFIQSFTLTFLAEWGDRSQITTIILGAREDVVGVIFGGTLGHALCTGLAVVGGRFIAQMISVRTVTLVGGVVFLLFALSALVIHPA